MLSIEFLKFNQAICFLHIISWWCEGGSKGKKIYLFDFYPSVESSIRVLMVCLIFSRISKLISKLFHNGSDFLSFSSIEQAHTYVSTSKFNLNHKHQLIIFCKSNKDFEQPQFILSRVASSCLPLLDKRNVSLSVEIFSEKLISNW